jgi:hypothetical protein
MVVKLVSDMKEEHRLRILDTKVLRRILGPKRDEVIEGWRKLNDEELHKLYSSNIIGMKKSRRMRWSRSVA